MRAALRTAAMASVLLPACGGGGGGGGGGSFGAITAGGAGQPVRVVTTLADDGPGSLREAVSRGNRYVTFAVSGTVGMSRELRIGGRAVTIDGTTAPPPGITLAGAGIQIAGGDIHDVVVQGLRIRRPRGDGIAIQDAAHRVRIDHVSVDGCGDGNIDITRGARDVTVSWSILSNCPKNSLVKFGIRRVSFHHNVFVRSQFRNPFISEGDGGERASDTTADVRNNLVWGWGNSGGGTGVECGARVNVIANFYSSPGTSSGRQANALVLPGCGGNLAQVYTSGNVSADGLPFDLNALGNSPTPFPGPPLGTEDACSAAAQALAGAGTAPRDSVDQARLAGIRIRCP